MGDEEYCSDCKAYTITVYDYNAGDTICSECGLVLESHFIDERPPERNLYSDKHDEMDDVDDYHEQRSRVSNPFNPLLQTEGSHLGLSVETSPLSNDKNNTLAGSHQFEVSNDRSDYNLIVEFRSIEQIASALGLVWTIKNHAMELYKKAKERRIFSRNTNFIARFVACLYLACQDKGYPRTLNEFIAVVTDQVKAKGTHTGRFSNKVKKRAINRAINVLRKHLEVGRNYDKTNHAMDIATRFCSNLGLNNRIINTVKEAVQKSQELDIRCNSSSILSATIYMVAQLSENKSDFRGTAEVAEACKVAETTLKKVYKDIYPFASFLIPNRYANAEDIKRLCVH